MVAFKSAKFDESMAEKWARFQKIKEEKQPLSALEAEEKRIKAQLLEAFGDEEFATLPNGQVLQRVQKSRAVSAKEARTDRWWEFIEVKK